MRLSDLVGSPFSLLFVDASCQHCKKLLRKLASQKTAATLPVVIACSGGPLCLRLARANPKLGRFLIQEAGELPTLMRVPATPAAYSVGSDRRTIGTVALGAQSVRNLLSGKSMPENLPPSKQAGANLTTPVRHGFLANQQALSVGSTIPPLDLTDLSGTRLLNALQSGTWTLLLFWSAPCAPCEALADPLLELCQTTSELEILVVGRGTPADFMSLDRTLLPFANRARIGLQHQRTVSRELNTFRTPTAYLISDSGEVSQPAAVGLSAVRQLLAIAPNFSEMSPA